MRKQGHRGFSLIEVLVALAILSVGLLAVARLQVAAINSLSYSRHLSTAIQLGEEHLEFMRSLPFNPALPNQAPRDESGALIQSFLSGAAVSPFAGDNVENDGITSGWHSHWNNPVGTLGGAARPGEWSYIIRWTVERGPQNLADVGHVFGVPGIGQVRVRLQVIWWENPKTRLPFSHANVSNWDRTALRASRARIVELEMVRQGNM